jgi:7-keto-8-aminopelargonate synthetase-like enzyme
MHWGAGDFADLRALVSLRRKHGFLLAIDEAHATFVCGNRCADSSRASIHMFLANGTWLYDG